MSYYYNMEINYNTIIKFLGKKHSNGVKTIPRNNFVTQKNIFKYATEFPDSFKELLTDKFYRYGITVYDNENNNISFWTSLLTLIDPEFIIPYDLDEITMVNNFKTQILDKFNVDILSSFLKQFDKNDMKERFRLEPDTFVLQYVVDMLDINFIIFDFKTQEIYSLFKGLMMNPWKPSLLFAKQYGFWEPIMVVKNKGLTQRLFDYNDHIFKKLVTLDIIKYYEASVINKDYICCDLIKDIIEQEKKKLKIMDKPNKYNNKLINDDLMEEDNDVDSDSSVKTNPDIFVNNDEIESYKKLNKTKLNKMNKTELLDLSEKLNIVISGKNITKTDLANSIISHISKL